MNYERIEEQIATLEAGNKVYIKKMKEAEELAGTLIARRLNDKFAVMPGKQYDNKGGWIFWSVEKLYPPRIDEVKEQPGMEGKYAPYVDSYKKYGKVFIPRILSLFEFRLVCTDAYSGTVEEGTDGWVVSRVSA